MPPAVSDEVLTQYQALTQRAGLADLGERTQVELTGADRATFLHNFCTADIKRLSPGSGCEAFITSGQGKTIGYVYVFCSDESITLDTSPDQAETLIAHLDRYLIREDVTLTDRTKERFELLLAGAQAEELLAALIETPVPQERLAHVDAQIGAADVALRRVDWARPAAFFVSGNRADKEQVVAALTDAGAAMCGTEAVEMARIEAGVPFFGRDVTAEKLPQEVNRNAQAISFTKGCYLGQETVARIDALGHVNRLLVGLRFESDEIPQTGAEAHDDAGKLLARVTSSCWSPKLNAPLALAYVRTGQHEPGAKLRFSSGEAEVVKLPVE